MGSYGKEKPKRRCAPNHHHFMRNVPCSDNNIHPVAVGLGRSGLSDFCDRCGFTRAELEAT